VTTTYGHEPVDQYADHDTLTRIVCARCVTWTHWRDVGMSAGVQVAWPCGTARLLGLDKEPA